MEMWYNMSMRNFTFKKLKRSKININKKQIAWGVTGIFCLAVIVYILFFGGSNGIALKDNTGNVADNIPAYSFISRVNGVPELTLEDVMPQVVGVMIDNHGAARPQDGLAEARVVYEVPVEGGITRFLAVYSVNDPVLRVGPVRSARPYYLDWVAEYGDTAYLHCGGSPEALRILKEGSYFDVNEFYRGQYFWRAKSRVAPHNLLTSGEEWKKLWEDYGKNRERIEWEGWKFEKWGAETATGTLRSVSFKFNPGYEVEWRYDEKNGRFERLMDGMSHRDASGTAIQADTVVIQFADMKVLDEVGRKEIITVDVGSARILKHGEIINATWKKETVNSRTRFFDEAGMEISFKPGRIWLEVLPVDASLTVTKQ